VNAVEIGQNIKNKYMWEKYTELIKELINLKEYVDDLKNENIRLKKENERLNGIIDFVTKNGNH
jgi:regulator of replication initiation timing